MQSGAVRRGGIYEDGDDDDEWAVRYFVACEDRGEDLKRGAHVAP